MQEVFSKIIEKLETYSDADEAEQYGTIPVIELDKAIEIVKQGAEKLGTDTNVRSNDWIPCSEHPPKECVPVNVTWINRNPESYYAKIKDVPFSATAVYYNSKWYWYSSTCVDYLSEYGENDFDLVDKDIDVIAWQPLPQPYQPKGEGLHGRKREQMHKPCHSRNRS